MFAPGPEHFTARSYAYSLAALVANIVAESAREIGIRMALGATVREAMIHVGSSSVAASGLGLLLGMIFCGATFRAIRSAIYGSRSL